MDTEFRSLIARGDLDLLGAFFEEHKDYGEQFDLIIDARVEHFVILSITFKTQFSSTTTDFFNNLGN